MHYSKIKLYLIIYNKYQTVTVKFFEYSMREY